MIQKLESTKDSLVQIAKEAMLAKGLSPEFPLEVLRQLDTLTQPASCGDLDFAKDLTDKLFFSIDNDDSRDLDQLTYAEDLGDNVVRAYVAIADVDCLVRKDTPIDKHAQQNTTSVYTPMIIFPMLPEKLSTDLTSLNPDERRVSIIVEMDVNENGDIIHYDVYQGCVFNYAKLAYNGVGAWLENKGSPPDPLLHVTGLDKQLRLQDQVAQRLKKRRYKAGTLTFETYDPQPVIKDGEIVDLQDVKINRARELIENFMVSANTKITEFMEDHQIPTVKRVVRVPKRWDRIIQVAKEHDFELPAEPDSKALEAFLLKMREKDPQRFPDLSLIIIKLLGRGEYVVQLSSDENLGHFALALTNYTHATAPNRRYPDLIVQRLIKASLNKKPAPYSFHILQEIASECTDKESRADKVKRSVMKSVIALYLQNSIGKHFDAFVTGKNQTGTWVRLISTAIEGKLVQGFEDVDVGDKIKVRLTRADVEKGFLDFVTE